MKRDDETVWVALLNQLHQICSKAGRISDDGALLRHADRMRQLFEDFGWFIEVPLGQIYDETRTDCVATIAGTGTENLRIVEVVKPIIRVEQDGVLRIVQRGIVVAQRRHLPDRRN